MNTEQITQVANSFDIGTPYPRIASCRGTLTEHISRYVDSIIIECSYKIPSFLKDASLWTE